jgi:hypothetical protein
MRRACLMLCALLPLPAGAAEVFKCRMPDGTLAFLDHACPEQAKALEAPKLAAELPFTWRCGTPGEPEQIEGKDAFAQLSPAQQQAFRAAASGLAYTRTPARPFLDRGRNLHLCTEPADAPEVEVVITAEGRVWSRRAGKVERIGGPSRISRLEGCSGRITGCVDPKKNSLDQCVDAAPICSTAEPAEGESCCPAACIERYRELRAQDVAPISAFDRALYKNEACSGLKGVGE